MSKTRSLLAAATPGPWVAGLEVEGWHSREYWRVPVGPGKIAATHTEPNATLIAHLRNTAELREAVVDAAREWQRAWRDPDASTRVAEGKLDAALAAYDEADK